MLKKCSILHWFYWWKSRGPVPWNTVSPDWTFSRTQRSYSNETECTGCCGEFDFFRCLSGRFFFWAHVVTSRNYFQFLVIVWKDQKLYAYWLPRRSMAENHKIGVIKNKRVTLDTWLSQSSHTCSCKRVMENCAFPTGNWAFPWI